MGDWRIHYNQFASVAKSCNGTQPRHVTGDFHRLTLAAAPGNSMVCQLDYNGLIKCLTDAPRGLYITIDDEIILPEVRIQGVNARVLAALGPPSCEARFKENLPPITMRMHANLVPQPGMIHLGEGAVNLHGVIAFFVDPGLENAGQHLADHLASVFTGQIVKTDKAAASVALTLDPQIGEQSYRLEINTDGVAITGGDAAGVFYGIQSLKFLIPFDSYNTPASQLALPYVQIVDSPRFGYRGLHFDIARNFHDLTAIKRVIDQMALFKLNALHLTLTNDEGWRVEIPGLPELTEIGSRRGHTDSESDRLYPAYGSGPSVDEGRGSGFLTREDYIDLLQYADARHILVIPEIDVPGHARAAIVAMKARYDRLMAEGNKEQAEAYLLHDPGDTSEYRSAQNYSDNVMCICRPSTLKFIAHVIDAVAKMHQDAGVSLSAVHTGGDEVPFGAWQGSPICLAEQQPVEVLLPRFLTQLRAMIEGHGAATAGWEEITLQSTSEGHNTTEINASLVGAPVVPYVWNSVWGWGREDMAYKLANRGFPIVMCNSSALYFDLAYNRDPEEPGLSWSGYVDTRTTHAFLPLNMFAVATHDRNDNPLSDAYVSKKIRLTPEGRSRVRGIQGQLWGESLDAEQHVDYYLFPKLLALAERAWSPEPEWVANGNKATRLVRLEEDWFGFASVLGTEILPRLDVMLGGIGYRLPLPGAQMHGDTIKANVRYPGLKMHYTTNKRDPDISDPIYLEPIVVQKPVRIATFDTRGRSSRVVMIGSLIE